MVILEFYLQRHGLKEKFMFQKILTGSCCRDILNFGLSSGQELWKAMGSYRLVTFGKMFETAGSPILLNSVNFRVFP